MSCECDPINTGFIPYNQLTQSAQGQDMSFLIGQTLKVKVVSVSMDLYAWWYAPAQLFNEHGPTQHTQHRVAWVGGCC